MNKKSAKNIQGNALPFEPVDDISLKNSLSSYDHEADISTTGKVYLDSNNLKFETDKGHLETSLDHSSCTCGCGGNFGAISLSASGNKCQKSCQCNNIQIDYETINLGIKENIKLLNRPTSDTISIIIENTDLTPRMEVLQREPIGAETIETIEDLETCEWVDIGYERVVWVDSEGQPVILWDKLVAINSAEEPEISAIFIKEPRTVNGKLILDLYVPNSGFMSAAYALEGGFVTFDPTETQIAADQPNTSRIGRTSVLFDGTNYIVPFETTAGTPKTYTSSSPKVSWLDESASNPLVSGEMFHTRLTKLSNGNMLMVAATGASNGPGYSVIRTPGGSWGSRVTIQGNNISNRGIAVTVDENGWVHVLANIANFAVGFISKDNGLTWSLTTTHPEAPSQINNIGAGYNIIAPGDGTLRAYYHKNGALLRNIMNTSTQVWAGSTTVNTQIGFAQNALDRGLQLLMDDSGNIHILTSDSGGNWHYFRDIAGNVLKVGQISTGINQFPSMQLTEQGDIVFYLRTAIAGQQIKIFDGVTINTEATNWFTSTHQHFQGHLYVDNETGGPFYAIGIDSFITYCENTDWDLPGVIDDQPPTITGQSPADGAIGVDLDTNIYMELDDDSSGVDSTTINVTINGVAAITAGVFQSGYSGTITADGLGFNVTINPDSNFSFSQVVDVVVDVDDLSGNSMVQDVYSFMTLVEAEALISKLESGQQWGMKLGVE